MIDRIARAGARLALALLLASSPAWAEATSPYTIHLLSGEVTPTAGVPAATLAKLAAKATPGEKRHVLVQLHTTPTPGEKEALAARGLELQTYVSGRAWIAALAPHKAATVLAQPEVRWATAWEPVAKLHPRLASRQLGPWARSELRPGEVKLFVQLHRDVALERSAELARDLGGLALPPVVGLHGFALWLPEARLTDLAGREEVLWVEEATGHLSAMNDGIRAQMGLDGVNGPGWGFDGEGVKILIYDDGVVEESHPTFDGPSGSRVTVLDDNPVGSHPTHVAGTAAGNGAKSTDERARGAAPAARILSAAVEDETPGFQEPFLNDLLDLELDYGIAVLDHDVDLVNNSIGLNVAGDGLPCPLLGTYDLFGGLLDRVVRGDHPELGRPLIVTWAASNERGYFVCGTDYATIGPPACAKNPITVGAVHSDGGAMTVFSGWGPCDDGRLKPIVVAAGCESGQVTLEYGIYSSLPEHSYDWQLDGAPICGTSMATPAVSGTIAAFIQGWRQLGFGQENERPLPALIKALLIHTAHDRGQVGPDYTFGYGLVDGRAFVDLLGEDDGELGNGNGVEWGEGQLETEGETLAFEILVPSNTDQLRATLAWDDVEGPPFGESQLVNDLRLEIQSPGGEVHSAWVLDAGKSNRHLPATRGDNTLDNQEQVVIDGPQAGIWKVRVTAASLPEGPQTFGLIYSTDLADFAACESTTSSFDEGEGDWSLDGAKVVANPDGSGSVLELNATDSATLLVTVPAGAGRALLGFSWRLETGEFSTVTGEYRDFSRVEVVRPGTNQVLAVLDERDSGWPDKVWMEARNLDLSPWQGQQVLIRLSVTQDGDGWSSTFYFDDVELTFCEAAPAEPTLTFSSIGGEDGTVFESAEESNVGGSILTAADLGGLVEFGDTSTDLQVKAILSFDTSLLPDDAEVIDAILRVQLAHVEDGDGDDRNPMVSLAPCKIDVKLGAFGSSAVLEPMDFEAPASASAVSPFGYASLSGEWSEANLLYDANPNLPPPHRVNETGLTQIRIFCTVGDDDDARDDLMQYFAGNTPPSHRPQLIVTYND